MYEVNDPLPLLLHNSGVPVVCQPEPFVGCLQLQGVDLWELGRCVIDILRLELQVFIWIQRLLSDVDDTVAHMQSFFTIWDVSGDEMLSDQLQFFHFK